MSFYIADPILLAERRMARNYLCCGVVEVGGVHNGDGMVCGRDAKLPASIAELHFACPHAERCELCSAMFCRDVLPILPVIPSSRASEACPIGSSRGSPENENCVIRRSPPFCN